jgi:hypothetical protein
MLGKSKLIWICSALTLLTLGLLSPHLVETHKEAVTQENLRVIQLTIEKWCSDHGRTRYPKSIEELGIATLSNFPENPYTHRPVRTVALGGAAVPGDFTYVPRYWGEESNEQSPLGYDLFAYGNRDKDWLKEYEEHYNISNYPYWNLLDNKRVVIHLMNTQYPGTSLKR